MSHAPRLRTLRLVVLGGAALGALGACSDATAPADDRALDLSAAFASLPSGYSASSTSYAGAEAPTGLWLTGGRTDRLPIGALMGGGLREAFVGGESFGGAARGHRGPFGGPFGERGVGCASGGGTFDVATGRVTCPTETRGGVTITRSAAYTTAGGAAQSAFDSLTTNTVNVRVAASGTVSFDSARGRGRGAMGFARDGGPGGSDRGRRGGRGARGLGALLGDTATILTATTTVDHASERTTAGLAQGSAQRTVNGTSRARETTAGTTTLGAFTATRIAGDTTIGLVVPVATTTGAPTYPTAGTVVRSMTVTAGYAGGGTVTATRREVVTYDGSATARVTITRDGTTWTCTRPLPRGPLSCS
jgi:hypothetical protein